MPSKKCMVCAGSGKVMGGGMMMWDCDDCDGNGKILIIEEPKDSASYKEAIESIKALDPSIDDEKAKEIFDEEFKKIDDKPMDGKNGSSNARGKAKKD
jgi:hypothetical protein